NKLMGVDVSHYQGDINWVQVRSAGISFVMIKAGGRGYGAAGNKYVDEKFVNNIKGAYAAGLKVGIYYYSTALNEEEALDEAKHCIDIIKPYKSKITYPVAYDFEEWNEHRTAGITGTQATKNAIKFLDYISSQGYDTALYASRNDYLNKFITANLANYKLWLAHWTWAGAETNYKGWYM
ncbi:GH25 family lysozyme, partial [Treponema sp. R6D11]